MKVYVCADCGWRWLPAAESILASVQYTYSNRRGQFVSGGFRTARVCKDRDACGRRKRDGVGDGNQLDRTVDAKGVWL